MFDAEKASRVMAKVGRKGGLARTPALTAARRLNGLAGGRPPDPEAVRDMTLVADAIPKADEENRAFLLDAFRRLAPRSLLTERWRAAWGEPPTSAERRAMRGWCSPKHRLRAVVCAKQVLGKS